MKPLSFRFHEIDDATLKEAYELRNRLRAKPTIEDYMRVVDIARWYAIGDTSNIRYLALVYQFYSRLADYLESNA